MEYFKSLNNLLFWSKNWCFFCKEGDNNVTNFICVDCSNNLEVLNREIFLESEHINKSFYVLGFNRFIKEQVYDYKFNGKSYLYKPLAQIMVETIIDLNLQEDIDLVCYIPSHRRKEAIRGYNQSELLAKYISEKLDLKLSKGNLIKYRHTKEQNKLDKSGRMSNLKNSFKVKRPEEIKGKSILLIDDIVTTGSTFIECAKILNNAGAGQITSLALTSSKKY